MAASNNSPVLDGIHFRPWLGKAAATNTGMTTNSATGNSIPPTAKSVYVSATTNDANDWITLPSLADVPNGHEINIVCGAGSNFEMRTPASSNEKINNVDSDGTQEYLCTDGDLIRVFKMNNTAGWIAQSLTNLGAVRSAVVPD